MKLIVKFFMILFVLGFGGLFILKKPDGTPWLSMADLIPTKDDLSGALDQAIPDQIIGGSSDSVSVYKWKDAEGNWQFSDTPPDNQTAEQVLVSTNLNRDLVPELKISEPKKPASGGNATLIKKGGISPTTVSPDKVTELIKDAKNVQNLMDQRQEQLDRQLGQ